MLLIIKPTGLCNFKCSFCSSGYNPIIDRSFRKVPDKIVDVVKSVKPDHIVITGGDPLLVEPSYYYQLYEISKCSISLTSNLKDFYLNPNKWIPLFQEKWLGVITSFQYGNKRLWNENTVYSEEMFLKIHELFKKHIGYSLSFISLIDYDNEDRVLDTCKLAKRLGSKVKINNVEAMGYQAYSYPRYKLFQHFINIFENNLQDYEMHCSDISNIQGCGINTNFICEKYIRTCYIDKGNDLHYFQCDNDMGYNEKQLDYKNDNFKQIPTFPLFDNHVNKNCWSCELFKICNGCKSAMQNYPKEHCEEMLKIKDKLKEIGWVDGGSLWT